MGSSAGDGVEEKLRIIPEGVPHYITSAVFVQIKDNGVENKTLSCVLPSNAGKV